MEARKSHEAWIALGAGLAWLAAGTTGSLLGLLLSLVPGVLLVATGAGELLWSDDRRMLQFCSLGGVLGVVLALPGLLILGFWTALGLGLLSAASLVAVGRISLRSVPDTDRVPSARGGFAMAAKVAVDEAVLSTMSVTRTLPRGEGAMRIRADTEDALDVFASRGWLEKPESYHRNPLPLDAPRIRRAEWRGITYEKLSFDSEYEPRVEEPGRQRWLGYTKNQTAHAWVLRHPGPARPWLVCIHGYRMGSPQMDIAAFDPRLYHQKLGLNLLLPVLPLHGERRYGRRSGDGFMGTHPLDTVHAEAQAMWDTRRLLSWVRAQGAPVVGVFGLSLGGYNAALLACLEQDLACAIVGIPPTGFERLLFRHSHDALVREFLQTGITEQLLNQMFRPISPLVLEPKVAPEGRAIFGGVVDRLVSADQVRDLHEHWGEPPIEWYQGSHLSFSREPGVKTLIETTLRKNGLAWKARSS
ncbi:MAG: alpha/beta hydrolase [Myxococcota bacterium]|nr:alpha/beta hydrolase [Myxococcota bacterium]